jgi:hypothetical protein
MSTEETGQLAATVDPPDSRPVSLADVLAAQEEVRLADAAPGEKRAERDALIRAALAAGTTTKAELARETGISEQHLGRIEKGRTSGARV